MSSPPKWSSVVLALSFGRGEPVIALSRGLPFARACADERETPTKSAAKLDVEVVACCNDRQRRLSRGRSTGRRGRLSALITAGDLCAKTRRSPRASAHAAAALCRVRLAQAEDCSGGKRRSKRPRKRGMGNGSRRASNAVMTNPKTVAAPATRSSRNDARRPRFGPATSGAGAGQTTRQSLGRRADRDHSKSSIKPESWETTRHRRDPLLLDRPRL